MANEFDDTIYSAFQRAFIAPPSDRVARTDTLTDEATIACRADCDTTWNTNWYQQQVDLYNQYWTQCETEWEAYRRAVDFNCLTAATTALRELCFYENKQAQEAGLRSCFQSITPKVPGAAGFVFQNPNKYDVLPTIQSNAEKKSHNLQKQKLCISLQKNIES